MHTNVVVNENTTNEYKKGYRSLQVIDSHFTSSLLVKALVSSGALSQSKHENFQNPFQT